ncbi:unnamed protein product [Symbiodinium sp. CCMP2592]|nr:unnamed protein product [Symbiodinium sp. CCMP2592]
MHRAGVEDANSGISMAMLLAEVERSVQAICTRLMEPHVEAAAGTLVQIDGLWDLAKANSRKLIDMDHVFRNMQEGLLKMDGLRTDLDRFDSTLNKQATEMESMIERYEVELQQLKMITKQKEEGHLQQRRALDAVRHELQHLQKLQSSCEQSFFSSLEQKFGELAPLKAEVEAKMTSMELKHHTLTDQAQRWHPVPKHFSSAVLGECAIAKVSGELCNSQDRFEQLKEAEPSEWVDLLAVVLGLESERDTRKKLENMQQELADWLGQSRFEAASVRKARAAGAGFVWEGRCGNGALACPVFGLIFGSAALLQAFSAAVTANKESVQIGLDVATTLDLHMSILLAAKQIASFMDEVRAENQKILEQTADIQRETAVTCSGFRAELDEHKRQRQLADARTEAILSELREALDEYDRRRKRERTTLELEMKEVGQQLAILHGSVENAVRACKSLDPLCGALVEVLAMQVSLERQEFADWHRVSLVGYKPVSTTQKPTEVDDTSKSPSKSPPKAPKQSPRKKGGGDPSQVISLDKRCYSCCSQSQMVMAGFKMACLQYKPSPVACSGGLLERVELFDRMEQLLEAARERVRYNRDEEVLLSPLPGLNPSSGSVIRREDPAAG